IFESWITTRFTTWNRRGGIGDAGSFKAGETCGVGFDGRVRLREDDGGTHPGRPPGLALQGGRRSTPSVEHREDERRTTPQRFRPPAMAREGRCLGRKTGRCRRKRPNFVLGSQEVLSRRDQSTRLGGRVRVSGRF